MKPLRSTSRVVPGLGAIVLCGGHSTRMGQSKAWLPFDGQPLLVRVVRRVAVVARPVVVAASQGQWIPPLPKGIVVTRDLESEQGPLQGIATALAALEGSAEGVFVTSTDAPFLAPSFVARMEALRREGDNDAAAVVWDGHPQPLGAAIRASLRSEVEALLREGSRGPRALLERVRTRLVTPDDVWGDVALLSEDPNRWSLRNVNTPEEYEAARRDAAA